MTDSSIELVWSAPAGAADYQVHRLIRTDEVPPAASMMTADNRLHSGEDSGVFLDEDVAAGELYWYGVRGLGDDGEVLSTGWHATAAVTDEEPPAQVELTVEESNGSVLLAWNEPTENFALHGYRILRTIGDAEPEVVATTWDLQQRSFIDGDPPEGTSAYSVVAFDFHWNDSAPTEVDIDLS